MMKFKLKVDFGIVTSRDIVLHKPILFAKFFFFQDGIFARNGGGGQKFWMTRLEKLLVLHLNFYIGLYM